MKPQMEEGVWKQGNCSYKTGTITCFDLCSKETVHLILNHDIIFCKVVVSSTKGGAR